MSQAVLREAWDDTLECTQSVMIAINDIFGIAHLLAPIEDITITEYENDYVIIKTQWQFPHVFVYPTQIIIDYTDDPTSDVAGSWCSLNHSGLRFDFEITDAKRTKEETTFVVKKGSLKIRSSAPDR